MLQKIIDEAIASQLTDERIEKILRKILFKNNDVQPPPEVKKTRGRKAKTASVRPRRNFAGDGDKTCPECGESGYRRLYKGICRKCFTQKNPQKNQKPLDGKSLTKPKVHHCGICGASSDEEQITEFPDKGWACNDPAKKCVAKLFELAKKAEK